MKTKTILLCIIPKQKAADFCEKCPLNLNVKKSKILLKNETRACLKQE